MANPNGMDYRFWQNPNLAKRSFSIYISSPLSSNARPTFRGLLVAGIQVRVNRKTNPKLCGQEIQSCNEGQIRRWKFNTKPGFRGRRSCARQLFISPHNIFKKTIFNETRNESFSSLSVAFYAIWDNLWGSGYEAPFEAENSFRAEFSGNFLPSRSYKGGEEERVEAPNKSGKSFDIKIVPPPPSFLGPPTNYSTWPDFRSQDWCCTQIDEDFPSCSLLILMSGRTDK